MKKNEEMRMQDEKGTVIGEKSMKNEEYKKNMPVSGQKNRGAREDSL